MTSLRTYLSATSIVLVLGLSFATNAKGSLEQDMANGLSSTDIKTAFQCGSDIKKSKRPTATQKGQPFTDAECSCIYDAVAVDTRQESFISNVQTTSNIVLYQNDVKVKALAGKYWRPRIIMTALTRIQGMAEMFNVPLSAELVLPTKCGLNYRDISFEDSK